MKKFEYKSEYKRFYGQNVGSVYKMDAEFEQEYLSKMGNDGWELVMIKYGNTYYWKREIIQK